MPVATPSACTRISRFTIHTALVDWEPNQNWVVSLSTWRTDMGKLQMGYSHIFCIIDMDTKDKEQYQKLKAKYAKPIDKPKKGIYCEVEFFETHRCTELFFLYYFRYTPRPYGEQETLLKDLNQCIEYRKTIEFFIKTKGLHGYFERNGGSLKKAMANANRSMDEKQRDGRDYTYSELGRLIDKLTALSEKH